MANEVYANGREIACKAAAGKTVAAFPDVCLSPPSPPAGPVPLPYPNTAYASDTTNGSTTVQISGKEIMLKDKSVFKTSTGNEAATKSLGMGVVTHTIQGEASFTMWSMDVKVEGANVDRHLDMTVHNEQCMPAETPPWPYMDAANIASSPCATEAKEVEDCCPNAKTKGAADRDCPPYAAGKAAAEFREDPCVKAKRCMLVPYDRTAKNGGCCPGQTPHHLVPKHHFEGVSGYNENDAPCVCAEGHSWHRNEASLFDSADKTHADLHDLQDASERFVIEAVEQATANGEPTGGRTPDHAMTYDEARDGGVNAHKLVFGNCKEGCISAQLDAYHQQPKVGVTDKQPVRTKKVGAGFESEDYV